MTPHARHAGALVLASMVVVAGCSLPFGADETPTETPTGTATPTPSPTPTPTPAAAYPDGVSPEGVTNATLLLNDHVESITETGYVVSARVNTTVLESGLLVDVGSVARSTVEANASSYYERRRTVGGPLDRREEMWGNETVEFRRVRANGQVSYERREPRHRGVLAGRPLLEPYLEGGNYTVEEEPDPSDPTNIRLAATSVDDTEALLEGLPEGAEEVQSFEATMQLDTGGRILSFEATVEFLIQGQERTHEVEYAIEETGDVTVEDPEWLEEAQQEAENVTESGAAGSAAVPGAPSFDGGTPSALLQPFGGLHEGVARVVDHLDVA